jgi:hypothetical protein
VDGTLRIISSVDLFRPKHPLTTLPYIKDGSNHGVHRILSIRCSTSRILKSRAGLYKMSFCTEHSSFPDHEPCDRRQLHWERVVGSCASYADRVARSPLLWEDSHEAIGRSSMETALTSILSSETGSYFALRRASLCDGAKRHALKGSKPSIETDKDREEKQAIRHFNEARQKESEPLSPQPSGSK